MAETKERLYDLAKEKPGLQWADCVFYAFVLLPLVTGMTAFGFWVHALLFKPAIPTERIEPLFWSSLVLMGVPTAAEYRYYQKNNE